jgi:hypothetical protein
VAAAAFALGVAITGTSSRDRRVVDVADAGDARSEAAHGFAAHDAISGAVDGKPYRQTRGWMHFAMTTFEDTEVTVSFTFVRIDTVSRRYDIVVEDSLLATRTFTPNVAATSAVDLIVPFSLTKGKTNIAVVIRARGGLTPALRQLRTIQDHYELDPSQNPTGVTR